MVLPQPLGPSSTTSSPSSASSDDEDRGTEAHQDRLQGQPGEEHPRGRADRLEHGEVAGRLPRRDVLATQVPF